MGRAQSALETAGCRDGRAEVVQDFARVKSARLFYILQEHEVTLCEFVLFAFMRPVLMKNRAIAYTLTLALSLTVALSVWTVGQEMPRETGKSRQPDLVELVKLDPTIKLDIRYATANNFTGRPVYTEA